MNSLCSHIDSNNITFSIHGKSLYKDQCLRCFEDLVKFVYNICRKVLKE